MLIHGSGSDVEGLEPGQPPSSSSPTNPWVGLSHLQALRDSGIIDDTEFLRRKQQLIDQLTGTKLRDDVTIRTKRRDRRVNDSDYGHTKSSVALASPPSTTGLLAVTGTNASISDGAIYRANGIVPRAPPDFTTIPTERAVVHTFDLDSSSWSRREVLVHVEKEHFARGSLRLAYHMTGLQVIEQEEKDRQFAKREERHQRKEARQRKSASKTRDSVSPRPKAKVRASSPVSDRRSYVAKMSIDPFEERDSYFADVVMQHYALAYAIKYNSYAPPKPIEFIAAWLVELIDRPNKPLCACEVFIDGMYRKHNNNFGFVSEDERNTPQAFSHFTYEASNHSILICDIQGVGDVYTDPQIHSIDGVGFGKGNMGERGVEKFCGSHRCNPICRYLKLPKCNPSEQCQSQSYIDNSMMNDSGTIPSTTYMSFHAVDTVRINFAMTPSPSLNVLPPITKANIQSPLINSQSQRTKLSDEDAKELISASRFRCCVIL